MIESFTLSEQHALGGQYTWRLKEGELRFRGTRQFAGLVNRRIPAGESRVAVFSDALDLLDVWSWRSDYSPNELGWEVLDGSEWSFSVARESRSSNCGGANAYPSFADVSIASLSRGRFACLVAAMYACFDIDTYVHIAAHQRGLEMREK